MTEQEAIKDLREEIENAMSSAKEHAVQSRTISVVVGTESSFHFLKK